MHVLTCQINCIAGWVFLCSQVGATSTAISFGLHDVVHTYILLALSSSIALAILPQLLASQIAGFTGTLRTGFAVWLMRSKHCDCDCRPAHLRASSAAGASGSYALVDTRSDLDEEEDLEQARGGFIDNPTCAHSFCR